LRLLGIDPQAIDAVVLSHIHQDHTGGLASLLAEAAHPTVYLLASFPGSFKRSAAALTSVVEVSHPVEIFPDVYSTGEVDGGIKEQALAIRTESGVVIITGCAHPGVARMVRRGIKASVPGDGLDETPVALVVGGFHLLDQSPGQIEALIADFESLHVRRVCPTHCTGDRAIAMFAKAFGEGYIPGGAGQVITLP
jgi:7,8-dihydropterin-6-yl-methyl-4-(beta-D-ribofuranosyl)aminobenzene 5'-phosphate synthase